MLTIRATGFTRQCMLVFIGLVIDAGDVLHASDDSVVVSQPNIVVILSDDMNWNLPGFNGGPAATPYLDRLANEGTRLEQFYVHAVCSPTRAAFLTGRYPFRNGMEERSHGNDTAGLLPDERTLAQALKEAGYQTALLGKWHLGNWYQRQLPLQRGFDYHYGLYGALVSYYGKTRDRYYDWHRNGKPVLEEGYTTDLIVREFQQHLAARQSGQPFFYFIPFNAIHGPDTVPDEKKEQLSKLLAQTASGTATHQHQLMVTKTVMLESMDAAIGRILDAIEARGYQEDTLIVFFNDNGGRQINSPFRGGKGDTYEGGVRVPCLFYWPGHVPAGKTVESMVHVVDLYPTLVKLAGGSLNQPLPLDGIDLWDAIISDKPTLRTEVVHSLPGEHVETGPKSIRQGPWKLVGDELYNLQRDVAETNDISGSQPAIVRQLNERLEQLVAERRPAETHAKIPDSPLLVFGEQENADPPAWLKPYLDSLDEPKKEKRKKNRLRVK